LAGSIQQSLNLLLTMRGLRSFRLGTSVSVYKLASDVVHKSYILRGNKEYSAASVCQLLGCHAGDAAATPAAPAPAGGVCLLFV
jgi:hypothetical protein